MSKKSSLIATALCLAIVSAVPAMAAISGAIYTTLSDGSTVNANLFTDKADVYLDGGPQNTNSAGISPAPGVYYFTVTDPSGATILSSDNVTCRQVQVLLNVAGKGVVFGVPASVPPVACTAAGGSFHAVGSVNAANGSEPVQLLPYDDTPNHGGVYKVWMCTTPAATKDDLIAADCKTDNFKVKNSQCVGEACGGTPQSLISGIKFYDKGTNGTFISGVYTAPAPPNGVLDGSEVPIADWKIVFSGVNNTVPFTETLSTDGSGNWEDASDVGSTITVCEVLQSGWTQSAPRSTDNANGIGVIITGTTIDPTFAPNCWQGTVPDADTTGLNFGNYEAVSGTKYYDTDVSGTPTTGDTTIAGIKILYCGGALPCNTPTGVAFTDVNGNYTFYLQSAGETYQIGEALPAVNNWSQTGPLNGALPPPTNTGNGTVAGTLAMNWLTSVGGSANGLYFTNVCRGTDTPFTLGYWGSSPVGKSALTSAFSGWATGLNSQFPGTSATLLSLINVAKGGNPAPPVAAFSTTNSTNAYSALSSFLMSGTGTNAANMLSVQAATMALNTLVPVGGKTVSGSDLMKVGTSAQLTANGCTALSVTPVTVNAGGYAPISDVLSYVQALLVAYPNTTAAGNARSCEAFVQTALNNANNNFALTIIKGAACSVPTLY